MKLTLQIRLLFLFFVLASCEKQQAPKDSPPKNDKQSDNVSRSVEKPKEEVVSKTQSDSAPSPVEKPKEEVVSKKKALLAELVGEHSLVSISGAMGANTMVDYVKDNGGWSASGSSISQGMREGYNIDITSAEEKALLAAKVVVSKDLSVAVLYDGKTYFNTPFAEQKMFYKVKGSPTELSFNVPKELQSNSTFVGEYLYLYLQDALPETAIDGLNIVGVYADAAILMYHVKNQAFELRLFNADCCDTVIYTFK